MRPQQVLREIIGDAIKNMNSNVCECGGFKFKVEMRCKKCWCDDFGVEFKGWTAGEASLAVLEIIKPAPEKEGE